MAWRTEDGTDGATITVNGNTNSVEVGSDFSEAVIGAAEVAGLSKFKVILNGTEIEPEDAPSTVSAGDSIELRRYEVAA